MATTPVELLDRARRFVVDELWTEDHAPTPRNLMNRLRGGLQLGVFVIRGFIDDQLLLRASALTYMTSLSIIPILVVLLSVISWLGLSRDVAKLAVDQLLAGSPEAVERIMDVVESANVGALGSLGGAIFLVMTILSLRHVEETFNGIWGARVGRSFVRRFTNYLAVLVSVPLILGTVLSLAPDIRELVSGEAFVSQSILDLVDEIALGAAPTVFFAVSFSLLYWVLPNTKVRVLSAVLGGTLAGLAFTAAQGVYVEFSVGVARYNALFGGFAMLPLLLVWIYISWSIVLAGAEFAWAHQNIARYRREARDSNATPAAFEATALRLVVDVARGFRDRWPPQRADEIADRLRCSLRTVGDLLVALERAEIVSTCGGSESGVQFQLGRPAESVSIADVLDAIRGQRDSRPGSGAGAEAAARAVEGAFEDAETALSAVKSRTIADLLQTVPESRP